jgi:hypothetical protein
MNNQEGMVEYFSMYFWNSNSFCPIYMLFLLFVIGVYTKCENEKKIMIGTYSMPLFILLSRAYIHNNHPGVMADRQYRA